MSRTPDWISNALKIVAEGVNALRDDKRAFIIVDPLSAHTGLTSSLITSMSSTRGELSDPAILL